MTVEVEVRSFISKEKYEKLVEFFKQEARPSKEDFQETIYFDCEQDLRLQKNKSFSKIWLKKGQIHDDWREEVEVKIKKEDFEKAKSLLEGIGLGEDVVWLRKRKKFLWKNGIKVCLDDTKGYGYIIELEKKVDAEKSKETHQVLVRELEALGIKITSKEEFQSKFNYYRKNCKKLIK